MIEKDVVLAALGSDVAVAGLVLVFAGFLVTKASSYEGNRAGDKYNWAGGRPLRPVSLLPPISGMLKEITGGAPLLALFEKGPAGETGTDAAPSGDREFMLTAVDRYVTSYHRTVVMIREGTIRPQRPHIRTERECVGAPGFRRK
jgi:hypothetical protein